MNNYKTNHFSNDQFCSVTIEKYQKRMKKRKKKRRSIQHQKEKNLNILFDSFYLLCANEIIYKDKDRLIKYYIKKKLRSLSTSWKCR
jgi:hypothetical protein